MANRGQNYNAAYTRRPQGQGQGQFQAQNQRQNQSFDAGYTRRDKAPGEYFNRGASDNRNNFNSGGGGGGNMRNLFDRREEALIPRDSSNPFVMNRGGNNDNRGGGGVNWQTRSSSSPSRGGQGQNRDDWNRSQQYNDGGNRGNNQGMNMGGGGGSGNQPGGQQVVMVVPQGNAGGVNSLMGMVPVNNQNPFVQPRQQPMQVIVGNLPAFNAEAIGQQILAAAASRPQFGQGMMNGGGPQGGLMNAPQSIPRNPQYHQQSQRFDGDNRSGQYAGQNKSTLQRSAVLRRRSEPMSGSVTRNLGTRSAAAAAVMRGNRKRLILRDRFGPTEAIPQKRMRTSAPAAARLATNLKGKAKAILTKKKDATKPADKKEAAAEEATAEETGEKKPSEFDDVPQTLLVCKVCQKTMRDASSYESHLTGKAHLLLCNIMEERFKKRAELLMLESKITEEEIGIEKDRQRRAGKGMNNRAVKTFCKMCDCNYYGNWGNHKASIGHRVLKEFLHPTCQHCNVNFVHRMEWVNHQLSAAHMKKLAEAKEKGENVEDSESTSQEQLFAVNVEIGKDDKHINIFKFKGAEFKAPSKEELREMLKEENGKLVLPEGEIALPGEYEENTVYGEDAIMILNGACCKVCRVYLPSLEEAETHKRSKMHYGVYVNFLKKIVALREAKKAAEEKAAKEAAEKEQKEKEAAEKAKMAQEQGEKQETMDVDQPEVKATDAKLKSPSPTRSPTKAAATVEETVKAEGSEKEIEASEEGAGDVTEPEATAEGEKKTPQKTAQANRGQQKGRGGRGTPRGSPARGGRGRGGVQRGGATPRGRGVVATPRGRGGRGGGGDTPAWRGTRGRGNFR